MTNPGESLQVTDSRLAVLRDIASPRIVVMCRRSQRHGAHRTSWRYDRRAPSSEKRKNVSARCDELERAGWIEMSCPMQPVGAKPQPWRLTALGRSILNTHTDEG